MFIYSRFILSLFKIYGTNDTEHLIGHEYRIVLLKEFIMKKIIRNVAAYNNMLAEIKAVMAAEEISSYDVTEHRNNHLYGGIQCYDVYSSGVETQAGKFFAWDYSNNVGTISSEGNLYEEEIPHISKDFMLKSIKLSLKEAFSAPEFVSNDDQCPADDDGMWWNNHRLVPSETIIEINNHRWVVYFQD